jgi:hypothetical protein
MNQKQEILLFAYVGQTHRTGKNFSCMYNKVGENASKNRCWKNSLAAAFLVSSSSPALPAPSPWAPKDGRVVF